MTKEDIYTDFECISCGSKEIDVRHPIYFLMPATVMVPNSYLLCEAHKNVRYVYDDIYTSEGERKKIDHENIIKRSEESTHND